jgi:hypothetical protein
MTFAYTLLLKLLLKSELRARGPGAGECGQPGNFAMSIDALKRCGLRCSYVSPPIEKLVFRRGGSEQHDNYFGSFRISRQPLLLVTLGEPKKFNFYKI